MPKVVGYGLATAVFLLMVVLFKEYQVAAKEYRQMIFENAGFARVQQGAKKAPDLMLLTQLREYIRFGRTSPKANMTDGELEWMKKVSHRYPKPSALYRYAEACYLNKKFDEFERVIKLTGRFYGEPLAGQYKQTISGAEQ